MKLPPIDEITSVAQISEWIDRWEEECLHVNPKDPLLLRAEDGFARDPSAFKLISKIKEVRDLFVKIKKLHDKINGVGHYRSSEPYYTELREWESERISLYNELQGLIGTPMSVDVDDNTSMPETHHQADFSQMESCQPTPKKKSKSIKSLMLVQEEQKESLVNTLHSLIDGRKGKDVALVILVCVQHGLMKKPEHSLMKQTFGDIGAKSGYNLYYSKGLSAFSHEEIKGIETHISSFIDGL